MSCEYPVCPCQRLCGFTGEVINPADSVYCHIHLHADHAHMHVHPEEGLDEEQAQRIADSHPHQYSEQVIRYAPLGAYKNHFEEWHGQQPDVEVAPEDRESDDERVRFGADADEPPAEQSGGRAAGDPQGA